MDNKRLPEINDLKNLADFELIEKFKQSDPGDFFKKYSGSKIFSPWTLVYGLLTFIAILIFFITLYKYTLVSYVIFIFISAIFTTLFIVLPLHELIHALVYKITGNKNIKFKLILKKLVVYTIADKQVVKDNDFIKIAFAPTFVLSFVFIITIILTLGNVFSLLFAFINVIHITMCIGDYSLLNFLWQKRKYDIYTYDDISKDMSYFYKKIK